MPKLTDTLKRILLIVLILAVGVIVLVLLKAFRKPPAKKESKILTPLLNAQVV